MATKITAPVKGYTGQTFIGPAVLDFDNGVAVTDVFISDGVRAYLDGNGYVVAEFDGDDSNQGGGDAFDPGKHSVDEVTAYLADADDAEVVRVKQVEAEGKNRKGIAEFGGEDE